MRNILVPVDFSEISDAVVAQAGRLARAFSSHVWIIHVAAPEPDFVGYDPGPQSVRDSRASELREEHRALQAIAQRLRDDGLEVTALLVQGPTVDTILEQADKVAADVLVVGSHGHGAVYRTLMGSVSEEVVRRCPRPVLIVPARRSA